MKELETFAYWITEREKVRLLHDAGAPKPWSNDWVFQKTYFCNVHREDDKVTKWIRTNWNNPAELNYEFAMCVARLLNKPSTLASLGYPAEDVPRWIGRSVDVLRTMAGEGVTIWGNAYVVTTHGQKMDKLTYLEGLLRDLWEQVEPGLVDVRRQKTLAMAHYRLTLREGFGSFMAAQVVADLKNTEGHALQFAEDWWNWSAYGPGSLRGLAWVYGVPTTPRNYEELMKELHPEIERLVYPIHMCEQDLQNCLCEFDKYMRVKTRTGRSKRKYNGQE